MSYTKPTSPKNGEIYYDAATNTFEIWNQTSSTWIPFPAAGGEVVPVGTVQYFAATTAPAGWIKANGDTIPNGVGTVQGTTADFSALYGVVGSTFGGPGRLPDLRGEFIRGFDDGKGIDSGRGFGTSQGDDFKSHNHDFQSPVGDANSSDSQGWTPPSGARTGFRTSDNATTTETFAAIDARGGSETRPRNVALLACIKYTTVSTISNSATNLYVDSGSGNDSNDGLTSGTAFATLQKGIQTAQTIDVPAGSFLNINIYGGFNITSPIDISHKNGSRVKIVGPTIVGTAPPGYPGGLSIGDGSVQGSNNTSYTNNNSNMHADWTAQLYCQCNGFDPVFTTACGQDAIGFENVLFDGTFSNQIGIRLSQGSNITLSTVGAFNLFAFGISFGGNYCFEGQCVATDMYSSFISLEGGGSVYAESLVVKNFNYVFNVFGASDVNIRAVGTVLFQHGGVPAEVNKGGRTYMQDPSAAGNLTIDNVNTAAVANTGGNSSFDSAIINNNINRSYTNNGHISFQACAFNGGTTDTIVNGGLITF